MIPLIYHILAVVVRIPIVALVISLPPLLPLISGRRPWLAEIGVISGVSILRFGGVEQILLRARSRSTITRKPTASLTLGPWPSSTRRSVRRGVTVEWPGLVTVQTSGRGMVTVNGPGGGMIAIETFGRRFIAPGFRFGAMAAGARGGLFLPPSLGSIRRNRPVRN